jgi:hypothetical protein
LAPFSNVDTEKVAKELLRLAPLVASELPDLARGEDGDDAIPVVGFELFRAVDDDESVRTPAGVEGPQGTRDVEQISRGLRGKLGVVCGHEESGIEKGLDV